MVKIATKLEDIGSERDQAVFMATVKLWFGGDIQAALDHYNASVAELEALDAEIDAREQKLAPPKTAEVKLRFKH
jgi:hypothetical protein